MPAGGQYEYVYEEYLYCTNCNKKVSDNAEVGDRCPHCGIYWSHDHKGNKAPFSGFSGVSFARIGGLVGAAIAIIVSLIVRALRS